MNRSDAGLRPTRASVALSVVFGVTALALLGGATVRSVLPVEVGGLCLLAVAAVVGRRWSRVAGLITGVLAAGTVLASVGLLWARTGNLLVLAQFAPGMVGLAVLTGGLLVPPTGSRRLVKAGTGLLILSVLVVGIVRRPSLTTLLGAGVLTVLAWDAGENAIGLGAHLGRRASTYRTEAVHLAGTALVGVVAVVGGRLVTGLGSPGLPLGAFVALVTALVLLAGALHG
jgi:hypothetical protein